MKIIKRKAFSMIEILFALVIVGVLATFSISKMEGNQNAGKITAAKSDLRALVDQLVAQRITIPRHTYDKLDWLDTSYDSDNDGFLDDGSGNNYLVEGEKVPWSKNVYVEAYGHTCNNSDNYNNGFYIASMVKDICSNDDCSKSPMIVFDSCKSGKIEQTIGWNGN